MPRYMCTACIDSYTSIPYTCPRTYTKPRASYVPSILLYIYPPCSYTHWPYIYSRICAVVPVGREGARLSLAPPHRVCHPDAMVLIAMVLISKTQCTVPVQMYCEKSCLESSCATIKETLSESFGNWSGYLWANFHMETLRNFFQNQSGICLDFLYEILKESLAK